MLIYSRYPQDKFVIPSDFSCFLLMFYFAGDANALGILYCQVNWENWASKYFLSGSTVISGDSFIDWSHFNKALQDNGFETHMPSRTDINGNIVMVTPSTTPSPQTTPTPGRQSRRVKQSHNAVLLQLFARDVALCKRL